MQLLLQHMAHPDAATTNGYTPLHISAREGQLETASVLMEAGASHSLATKVRMGGGQVGAGGCVAADRDRVEENVVLPPYRHHHETVH